MNLQIPISLLNFSGNIQTATALYPVNAEVQYYPMPAIVFVNDSAATILFQPNNNTFSAQESTVNGNSSSAHHPNPTPSWLTMAKVQIPLYAIILLLAIIGNFLVIITLVQNRRMRTITNVFLLNLAVSDILLGVLCMPFTLIGALLRDFVFGEIMCKCLPYLEGE